MIAQHNGRDGSKQLFLNIVMDTNASKGLRPEELTDLQVAES